WSDAISVIRQNMANSFVTRQQAVDIGQNILSPGIGPILVRNGSYLELRGPGQTADQLFPEFPNWGILDRYPRAALFESVVSQAGLIHLVNQAATTDAGVTTITADVAPATAGGGITVGNGLKVLLTLPPGL